DPPDEPGPSTARFCIFASLLFNRGSAATSSPTGRAWTSARGAEQGRASCQPFQRKLEYRVRLVVGEAQEALSRRCVGKEQLARRGREPVLNRHPPGNIGCGGSRRQTGQEERRSFGRSAAEPRLRQGGQQQRAVGR